MLTLPLRLVALAGILSFSLFSCEQDDDISHPYPDVFEVNVAIDWLFGSKKSVDIDADGVGDITFDAEGGLGGHFSSGGNCKVYADPGSGIEFLVDSFEY